MVLALAFTLISTSLLGSTLAKYTSTDSGSDTARVAKWGFGGINTVDIFNFTYDGTVLADDGVTKIVAPGTGGAVNFGIEDGVSEVSSTVTFAITETNSGGIPIVYQVGSNYYSSVLGAGTVYLKQHGEATFSAITITGNISDMGTYLSSLSTLVPAGTNYNTLGGTVRWFWAFEQDATDDTGGDIFARDGSDTALGIAAAAGTAATVTLNVTIAAVQVD